MIIFAVIVLTLEKIGGMNSVVLSDAVQALLMIFGFLAVFFTRPGRKIDYEKVIRGVVAKFDFDFFVDDLSSRFPLQPCGLGW